MPDHNDHHHSTDLDAFAATTGDAPSCPTCAANGAAGTMDASCPTCAAGNVNAAPRTNGYPLMAADAPRAVASRPYTERADIEIVRQRDVDLFAPFPIAPRSSTAPSTTFLPSVPTPMSAEMISPSATGTFSTMQPASPPESPQFAPLRGRSDSLTAPGFPVERVTAPPTEGPIIIRTRDVDLFPPPAAAPSTAAPPTAPPSGFLLTPTLDFERISYGTRIREFDLYVLPTSSESSKTPASPFSPLEHTRSRLDTRTRLYDITAQPSVFDEIMERLHSGESYDSGADKWAHLKLESDWRPVGSQQVKPVGLAVNWSSNADGSKLFVEMTTQTGMTQQRDGTDCGDELVEIYETGYHVDVDIYPPHPNLASILDRFKVSDDTHRLLNRIAIVGKGIDVKLDFDTQIDRSDIEKHNANQLEELVDRLSKSGEGLVGIEKICVNTTFTFRVVFKCGSRTSLIDHVAVVYKSCHYPDGTIGHSVELRPLRKSDFLYLTEFIAKAAATHTITPGLGDLIYHIVGRACQSRNICDIIEVLVYLDYWIEHGTRTRNGSTVPLVPAAKKQDPNFQETIGLLKNLLKRCLPESAQRPLGQLLSLFPCITSFEICELLKNWEKIKDSRINVKVNELRLTYGGPHISRFEIQEDEIEAEFLSFTKDVGPPCEIKIQFKEINRIKNVRVIRSFETRSPLARAGEHLSEQGWPEFIAYGFPGLLQPFASVIDKDTRANRLAIKWSKEIEEFLQRIYIDDPRLGVYLGYWAAQTFENIFGPVGTAVELARGYDIETGVPLWVDGIPWNKLVEIGLAILFASATIRFGKLVASKFFVKKGPGGKVILELSVPTSIKEPPASVPLVPNGKVMGVWKTELVRSRNSVDPIKVRYFDPDRTTTPRKWDGVEVRHNEHIGNEPNIGNTAKLIDPSEMQPGVRYRYVVDVEGNIRISNDNPHSRLVGDGEPVFVAGEIFLTNDGKVKLNLGSGHYMKDNMLYGHEIPIVRQALEDTIKNIPALKNKDIRISLNQIDPD